MEYRDLYCLDKKGKIRIFKLIAIRDGEEPGIFNIITSTGLLNGKLTDKVTTIDKGKSNRTLEEQAVLQADSLYNEKRNEGYKSLNDLFLKAESEHIDTDIFHSYDLDIKSLFDTLKITHNTDTSWRPLPMLAEKWKKHKDKVKYPVLVQPKLNGVRCIASYDKDLQEVVLASRGGKTYNIPHIKLQLTPFFLLNQNLYLDGEIYIHGKHLQEISGDARREDGFPSDVEYHLYDCIINKKQSERLEDLRIFHRLIVHQFGATDIKRVTSFTANNQEEVIEHHNNIVQLGYEGAIVRDPEAFYQISFRDKCLLKVKEFEDEEFEILNCATDGNKTIGESFVFILKNNTNDMNFKARPTGTLAEKELWYKNIEQLKGSFVTTRFQERSKDDLPIQAHVRHTDSKVLYEILKNYGETKDSH